MQSFIQYRKFRTAIQAQLERDRAKTQGVGQNDRAQEAGEDQSPSSSTSEESNVDESKIDESKFDLEKGQNDILPTKTDEKDFKEPVEEIPEEAVEDDDEDDDDDDFELSQSRRALSRRTLSRISTQSAGTKLGQTLTGIQIRKRTTTEGGGGNVFVVGYEGEDDPLNPHNWSNVTRIRCTVTIAGIGAVVGFASAIDSAAIPQAAKDFGVSDIVESLATALYFFGFGTGALFSGPFSETFGRNPVYIVTMGLFMIFIMASALAPNIGTQLVFRFLAGVFGSTPLVRSIDASPEFVRYMLIIPLSTSRLAQVVAYQIFGPLWNGYVKAMSRT